MRAEDQDEHRAADQVEEKGAEPELQELQERLARAVEPGDRDEEVLREELRAPHEDEDEGEPERDRAGEVREGAAEVRPGQRCGEPERRNAERDVEATDERRCGEFDRGAGEPATSLFTGARKDFLRLRSRHY